MRDFISILGEVMLIVTFQHREARTRPGVPLWEERLEARQRRILARNGHICP
jgi:hypothetical protein